MESFGRVGNEFINLYSESNQIMESGESCYFLLQNNEDFHRPLMCSGVIVDDKFTDGMNKIYHIKLTSFLETPKTVNEFVNNKPFYTAQYNNDNVVLSQRLMILHPDFDFNSFVFKIESFFTRKTEENLLTLRNEYIKTIREDVVNMLKDIDSI